MRSSLLIVFFALLSLGRADADPAVEQPFDPPPGNTLQQGKCVKWSTGLVGTVCSFCMDEDEKSCRMCRDGFGSATCSYAKRGEAPTFGTCHADGDDMVCEWKGEHCRYSATRAACYTQEYDTNKDDVAWINARVVTQTGDTHCVEQPGALVGRACVRPAPDSVHGQLCFFGAAQDPLACTEVASPIEPPTFGTCSGPEYNRICDIGTVRCRYWGGYGGSTVTDTQCYDTKTTPDGNTWVDDDKAPLGGYKHPLSHSDYGGGGAYRLPNTVYVGIELGMARPGATDYFSNGNGRAVMVGIFGFELRIFEGYDLPDPKMQYTNVAGTSNAFVISSLAYRYQLASRSAISLSLLGGVAVMHRSLFGTSGDQIPGFEDFPEVQWQFGGGAMLGGGVVLFGHAYVDVRAYPAVWGGIGVGDNAASPGGVPITLNGGIRIGI